MSFLRAIAFLASGALAIGQRSTVNFDGSGILLASNTSFVNIYADPNDWPAVLRVCDDLAMDFGRITGTNGSVIHNGNGTGASLNASMIFNVTGRPSFGVISSGSASGGVIIAGTLGRSSVIDRLVAEGKLDVTGIEGSWEAYVSAIVHDPLLGVEEAMVIAGLYLQVLVHTSLTNDQAPTDVDPSLDFTAFRSRSASLRGTTGPTLLRRSIPRYMRTTLQSYKPRHR